MTRSSRIQKVGSLWSTIEYIKYPGFALGSKGTYCETKKCYLGKVERDESVPVRMLGLGCDGPDLGQIWEPLNPIQSRHRNNMLTFTFQATSSDQERS